LRGREEEEDEKKKKKRSDKKIDTDTLGGESIITVMDNKEGDR